MGTPPLNIKETIEQIENFDIKKEDMNKIHAYECEYCRRIYRTQGRCANHEAICYRNPVRTIAVGELATDKFFLCGPLYSWLPDNPGCIWTGAWEPVPGYQKQRYVKGVGILGEVWPLVPTAWGGLPLNLFPLRNNKYDEGPTRIEAYYEMMTPRAMIIAGLSQSSLTVF